MTSSTQKIEYGDWQTPPELAARICQKLVELGSSPNVIIEPTCGIGSFIKSATQNFPHSSQIIGYEINQEYVDLLQNELAQSDTRVTAQHGDFFKLNWQSIVEKVKGEVLIIGNLPWVTNSVQGVTGGTNLPLKSNFQFRNGIEAMTGKSNFDISEWMLMQLADALRHCQGTMAILCKTSVARKVMNHLRQNHFPVKEAALFKINAAKYFDAAVDACLLFCQFGGSVHEFDYMIHDDLDALQGFRTGWRKNVMISNLSAFDETQELFGHSDYKWRSGIKHDCSEVMELKSIDGVLQNGLGEKVAIEDAFLFPLFKGSDIANSRESTNRFLIVPQKSPGEETRGIQIYAPKTWEYLAAHSDNFDRRKSRIYENSPPFSVFGIGSYTFLNWKIAICGLYKKLEFKLIGPVNDKPVVFDDTVYFLSYKTEDEARTVLNFLHRDKTLKFLDSMIFWDEKRPIKSSVLNSLRLPSSNTQMNWLIERS